MDASNCAPSIPPGEQPGESPPSNDSSISPPAPEAFGHSRDSKVLAYRYLLAFGGAKYAGLVLCSTFATQVLFFSMNLWLATWVGAYDDRKEGIKVGFYLGIFAALFLISNLVSIGVAIIIQNGAWIAARRMHRKMVEAVLRVSLSWFNAISIGRIMNRFSRDINSLDSLLANNFQKALYFWVQVLFRIGAVGLIMPIFAIPTAFMCFIGYVVGDMDTRTAASAKRLATESQSPVFAHFSETLAGLSVVRARAGMQDIMGMQLAEKLRVYARAAEAQYNSNRWVSVRTDLVASTVALGASLIELYRSESTSAGLVGFSLTSAIGLSQTIIQLVRSMNELDIELTSFQRVQEYSELPAGEESEISVPIPASWPSSGTVEFRNITARYTPDGPDILIDVSFTLRSGERTAIVGLTGSAKSTLALSFLRVTYIVSGSILYGGIDITHIPLDRLRQSLTIIPQDTVLFSGDISHNLDPTEAVDRHDLENALSACSHIQASSSPSTANAHNMEELTSNISLSTPVAAGGQNFSHGQRQILGLARALVKRSKLVILDEATASMDYETDAGVQGVLRSELEGSTLVTIAHRLSTIIDYDRVIVMAGGKIVETGLPKELHESKGAFADMVAQGGKAEELIKAFGS